MLHFSRFSTFNKFPATYAFHMCVEYDRTYIYDKYYQRTHVYGMGGKRNVSVCRGHELANAYTVKYKEYTANSPHRAQVMKTF